MYQLVEARGWLPLVLCAFVLLLSLRCLLEAWLRRRSGKSSSRRQAVVGGVLALIAPLVYHPYFAALPAILAIALVVLALETRRNRLRPLLDGAAVAVLVGGVGMLALGYTVSLSYGPSMWPASPRGFSVSLLETRAYSHHGPERGDRVQVWIPRTFTHKGFDPDREWPGGRYHKRIFGLPGDHVQIDLQGMRVNGKRVADCMQHGAALPMGRWLCRVHLPAGAMKVAAKTVDYDVTWGNEGWFWGNTDLVVPPGKVFLLGDNLTESADSRDRGVVSMDWIVGRHM